MRKFICSAIAVVCGAMIGYAPARAQNFTQGSFFINTVITNTATGHGASCGSRGGTLNGYVWTIVTPGFGQSGTASEKVEFGVVETDNGPNPPTTGYAHPADTATGSASGSGSSANSGYEGNPGFSVYWNTGSNGNPYNHGWTAGPYSFSGTSTLYITAGAFAVADDPFYCSASSDSTVSNSVT